MAFANGAGTRVAWVQEASYGVTPATPSFDILRVVSSTLRTNKATGVSDELQADRNIRDEFQLGQRTSGNLEFELSRGSMDKLLAHALCSSWSTDVLVNGVDYRTATIEETYELGATDSFSRFVGQSIDSISFDVTAEQVVKGSMALVGKREVVAEAPIAGATYAAPNTNPVLTASAHVGSLSFGADGTAALRRVQIEIKNNTRPRPVVGDLYSAEMGQGRFDVTGRIEAYFANGALYQKMLDHETSDLSFKVGAVANERYRFNLPKLQMLDGERTPRRNDQDVMVNIPFRGVYAVAQAGSIQITRNAA
ncbi:MAG: phage tail protein [Ancylobacter novellus]|uniref:Phage tail protein n=1 Tax=Ancylobacter novellus TaxID=921 RepID=A0A2W5MYY4_ANCNO|nr:MAG: phage tail protein [Ancylobacter novellus]